MRQQQGQEQDYYVGSLAGVEGRHRCVLLLKGRGGILGVMEDTGLPRAEFAWQRVPADDERGL